MNVDVGSFDSVCGRTLWILYSSRQTGSGAVAFGFRCSLEKELPGKKEGHYINLKAARFEKNPAVGSRKKPYESTRMFPFCL